VGDQALAGTTSGSWNTGIGYSVLAALTTGEWNTAVGAETMAANTTGLDNTSVGHRTMNSNVGGSFNTVIGKDALRFNVSGKFNVALGMASLIHNNANSRTTAVGYEAMRYADNRTDGRNTFNTAVGCQALRGPQNPAANTGTENTAIGDQALFNTTSGMRNTALGTNALHINDTGNENVGLGAHATMSAGNLSNATALGTWTIVNASNKVRVGNGVVTVIEGQVAWSHPSDGRFKFNVRDDAMPGLDMVSRLRPVTYQFDARKYEAHLLRHLPDSNRQVRLASAGYDAAAETVQSGFIAQEVEQICRDLGYDFSGLHVPEGEDDNYSIAYASFVPVLVKAIQEQQEMIARMENTNASLMVEVDTLSSRLETLSARLDKLEGSKNDE